MRELIRTNDIVLVSAVGALLDGANIRHQVLDQNMSVIEGSLGSCRGGRGQRTTPRRRGSASPRPASAMNCGPMIDLVTDFTEDAFLGGQLRLRQPQTGHRAGHDAILLAAATEARAGDRVVDLGAGIGTAGLALAPSAWRESASAWSRSIRNWRRLARANATANAIAAETIVLDVTADADRRLRLMASRPDSVDVVLMNPPFNDPARHRGSPDQARRTAHVARETFECMGACGAAHPPIGDGALTLIWRADGIAEVLTALVHAVLEACRSCRFTARRGRPRSACWCAQSKAAQAPTRLLPGLMLNETSACLKIR